MDFSFKHPLPLSTHAPATFPLVHGATTPRSHRSSPGPALPISDEPFAGTQLDGPTGHGNTSDPHSRRRPSPRQLLIDPLGLDGPKSSHHRHKHSKSRELRLPRPMNHLASSAASARGLLPTWSGREKDRESDDGLLRPITRETTRTTRWGSDSTVGLGTGSRKGSLLDVPEFPDQLGPIRRQGIQNRDDLDIVKKRRKQGEHQRYLRTALSSIGSQATDVTRRLDYTYYNLLEKVTALNATIASFQELSDSASTLLNDFERETAGLDQEIRKQINELKGFEPQVQKADALEERMKTGRRRVEDLGNRLEAVRQEIDRWERREAEWQTRVSRRLRIFWMIVTSAVLVLALAIILQNWPASQPPLPVTSPEVVESVVHEPESFPMPRPSSLADRLESLHQEQLHTSLDAAHEAAATPTGHDPLALLEDL
ncbi:hypothetical protein N7474_010215 [Penicillium riverlandense]|uniref:uncharacterized protein n=1 Tax=Penicillium riverlandense TaxID=1903569 RepID=UPI002546FB5C|nr:uncharacterized protein N7474_010215 [Penicillium riverlandense]KAJ5808946.1 hypothetical protein N7474_010215 [Penicillium riverlandense]